MSVDLQCSDSHNGLCDNMMDPSLKSDAEVACLVCADLATWSRGGGMSDVMPHAGVTRFCRFQL